MHHIVIQHAAEGAVVPKATFIRQWAKAALRQRIKSAEIVIRIVSTEEMTELNAVYRHKQGPTNVLSFPFQPYLTEDKAPFLGDIVICADIVNAEAQAQHKASNAHWAHIIVHGVFHLLGYDHEKANDARIMETLEIKTLKGLGFKNPYILEIP